MTSERRWKRPVTLTSFPSLFVSLRVSSPPPSYRLPLIVTLGYTSRFLGGAGSDGRRDEASEWRERDETRQTEGTVNDEGPRSSSVGLFPRHPSFTSSSGTRLTPSTRRTAPEGRRWTVRDASLRYGG